MLSFALYHLYFYYPHFIIRQFLPSVFFIIRILSFACYHPHAVISILSSAIILRHVEPYMETILTSKAVSYLYGKSTKHCALLTKGRRRKSFALFVKYGDTCFSNELSGRKHFLSVAIALLVDEFPLPVVNNIRTAF